MARLGARASASGRRLGLASRVNQLVGGAWPASHRPRLVIDRRRSGSRGRSRRVRADLKSRVASRELQVANRRSRRPIGAGGPVLSHGRNLNPLAARSSRRVAHELPRSRRRPARDSAPIDLLCRQCPIVGGATFFTQPGQHERANGREMRAREVICRPLPGQANARRQSRRARRLGPHAASNNNNATTRRPN